MTTFQLEFYCIFHPKPTYNFSLSVHDLAQTHFILFTNAQNNPTRAFSTFLSQPCVKILNLGFTSCFLEVVPSFLDFVPRFLILSPTFLFLSPTWGFSTPWGFYMLSGVFSWFLEWILKLQPLLSLLTKDSLLKSWELSLFRGISLQLSVSLWDFRLSLG